ncbi:hypothetical protein AVEN_28137-1, partial [Araneus ventricosus]
MLSELPQEKECVCLSENATEKMRVFIRVTTTEKMCAYQLPRKNSV